MKQFMNASQVLESFKEISGGIPEDDEIMLNEAFNNYTDSLCKDREIPAWLYERIEFTDNKMDIESWDDACREFAEAMDLIQSLCLDRDQWKEATNIVL